MNTYDTTGRRLPLHALVTRRGLLVQACSAHDF